MVNVIVFQYKPIHFIMQRSKRHYFLKKFQLFTPKKYQNLLVDEEHKKEQMRLKETSVQNEDHLIRLSYSL